MEETFGSLGTLGANARFGVDKRDIPAITSYDEVGNSGKCTTNDGDNQAFTRDNDATRGFGYRKTIITFIRVHWTADAEL